MIIVSPYKPCPQKQHSVDRIGEFDWIQALGMLGDSAARFDYPVVAITDQALPVPHLQFATRHDHLMLWILEVSLAYLESEHFTQDTAFVCPDSLIANPFPRMDRFDLGVAMRFAPKYKQRPLLNSVQLWPVKGREPLIAFYRQVLRLAESSPDGPKWGDDSKPITKLLQPVMPGIHCRAGLRVAMFSHLRLMHCIGARDIHALASGEDVMPTTACVVDFKAGRKVHMKAYYEATK